MFNFANRIKTIMVRFNCAKKGEMINVEENIVVCSTHIIPSHVIVRCRVVARKRDSQHKEDRLVVLLKLTFDF